MRRNDNDRDVAAAPPSTASAMMTPLDIQQKEFQVSRFGGYRMRDVDEFLDQLTDAMQAVLAENERLRAGAGPIVGSPDLDDVSRQADEIIQRARAEAARIVADAQDRAAPGAAPIAAGSVTAADRAAIDAFLARERAFLQRLAGLVQEHADGVKGMAREVRRRSGGAPDAPTPAPAGGTTDPAAPASPAVAATPAAAVPAATPPAAAAPAATASQATGDAPAAASDLEATRPIEAVAAEAPIVVNEPEPARSGRDDEGDESLRELFWGEEG